VLPGALEAVLGWLALNARAGTLPGAAGAAAVARPRWPPVPLLSRSLQVQQRGAGGRGKEPRTLALIDLGGSSMEMAVEDVVARAPAARLPPGPRFFHPDAAGASRRAGGHSAVHSHVDVVHGVYEGDAAPAPVQLFVAGHALTVQTTTAQHVGLTDLFDRSVTLLLRHARHLAEVTEPHEGGRRLRWRQRRARPVRAAQVDSFAPPGVRNASVVPHQGHAEVTLAHPCLPPGSAQTYVRLQHLRALEGGPASIRLHGGASSAGVQQSCSALVADVLADAGATCPRRGGCGAFLAWPRACALRAHGLSKTNASSSLGCLPL
jgi:hypothetical protein